MKKILTHADFPFLIISAIVVLLTYWQLSFTFYQQDEWMNVGHFLVEGVFSQIDTAPLYLLVFGGMRILSLPFHIFAYYLFPMQIWPFVLFSLFFHTLNSFLVYLISKKISSETFIAFVASVFFAVSGIASQAVTWAGASTTTLPAAFFTFLSILLFLRYIDAYRKKDIILTFVFAVAAFLFKESSIILLLIFPVLYILSARKKKINIKVFLPFLLYFGAAVGVRIFDLLTSTTNPVGKYATDGSSMIDRLMYFSWMYPLSAISQYFIPPRNIFDLALKFQTVNYPFVLTSNQQALVAERIVGELLSIIASFITIITFLVIWPKIKSYHKTVIFAFMFLAISILPFIIIERGNAYLESRYYYLGTLGAGILLGVFTNFLLTTSKAIKVIPKKLQYIPVFLFLGAVFYFQFLSVHRDFDLQVELASVRKSFIADLKNQVSDLPEKPVFLIEGNQAHYVSNQFVPFQQGMGYTLMVLYYDTGRIPPKLLIQNFLWNLGEEGYKEAPGKGFGYFADREKLNDLFAKGIINPHQIIALEYNSKNKSLVNKTLEFRREFIVKDQSDL